LVYDKKTVLFVALGIFGFVFVTNDPIMFGLCKNIVVWPSGTEHCNDGSFVSESIGLLCLFLSLSLLFLSLVTYWMKESIFRAWWNFARWWVVAIIVVTLYIESASGGSGGMGIGGAVTGGFNIFIESILYAVMIIGSLTKIIKTYLKTR
jgi:hypothetical protein